MKTNYFAHNAAYRNRRERGQSGWADAATLESNLQFLDRELQRGLAPSSGKVLELGCGAGELSLHLSELGYETVGVDIAPYAIEWAKEKAAARELRARFLVGNVVDQVDVADDAFDFVLDGYCLHCIIGDDRSRFLANSRRVLKDGAPFFSRTMCGDLTSAHLDIGSKLRDSYDSETRCVVGENGFANRYIGQPEEIVLEIERAGFEVVDWRVEVADGKDEIDTIALWAR